MKTNLFLTSIILLVVMSSCKDKNNEKVTDENTTEKVKENFSVEVDVVASKKDDFALYYTEDNTITFTGEQAIWAGVKGGNVDEKVVFEISDEIVPTDIRLDFGLKKGADQGDVTLKNFKMNFYGKSFEFKGSDFFNYFAPNANIETKIDVPNGTITFLKNPSKQDTPFYYPKQTILDQLALLTKS